MPENRSKWHPRAVCPKCGWHTYAPFADVFHVHLSCCPECGKEVKGYDNFRFDSGNIWRVETMRYISEAKLWKPRTWGTGHWETKEEKE